MYRKEIVYDRETRDYAMYLDSELVGFARSYHEAEVTLDQLVFELLSGEFFREAPPVETHARMAEPEPEFIEVEYDEDEPTCACGAPDGMPCICDVLDNQPASDAFPEEPIGECALDGKPAWRLDETLAAPLCPDHKAQEREWVSNRDVALTGAPVAPVDTISPVAPTLPSASQDGAAAGAQPAAPAPQMCHWCMMPFERFVGGVPCCHWCATRVRPVASDLDPRATLIALLKASLEEWQALGLSTPYDVALAQLARLMSPPSGHFLTCGVCGGPHIGWQCPQVAREKARQIEQAKWGETMTYLHRHHRELLISSMQTAPLLEERAEALALYLTHATGVRMDVAMVERALTQLAQQNAAPA
jgi:hypothetical protein